MRTSASLASIVVVTGLALACGDSTTPTAVASEIQSGQPIASDPAVGIVDFVGRAFCTATLIAPDVVLTAAHCADAWHPIDAFYTGKGKPAGSALTEPASLGMIRHAAIAQATYPRGEFGGCPKPRPDVALVKLAAPITTIAPAAIGAAPALGTACRAVGFGSHDADAGIEFLQKREATATLTALHDGSLEINAGSGIADHGDSGGPLFCNDVLVGTTSCHTDGEWPQHQTEYYGSVGAALPWIRAMIAHWDPQTDVDGSIDAGSKD